MPLFTSFISFVEVSLDKFSSTLRLLFFVQCMLLLYCTIPISSMQYYRWNSEFQSLIIRNGHQDVLMCAASFDIFRFHVRGRPSTTDHTRLLSLDLCHLNQLSNVERRTQSTESIKYSLFLVEQHTKKE